MALKLKSTTALTNTIALMEAYEMFNHLTEGERERIIFTLKQLALAGYEDARRIIANTTLELDNQETI